jgi:N-acetylmuramoyl-L-alanine amidase
MTNKKFLYLRLVGLGALVLVACSPARPGLAQQPRPDSIRDPERPIAPSAMPTTGVVENISAAAMDGGLQGAAVVSERAALTGVRFLSWKNYTRVMLELSQEAKYEVRQLKEDSAKGLPSRVYVDIQGARVAMPAKEPISVDDGLLRQVRVGQYNPEVVRVVLDMTNLGAHNAFVLPDPYRLVIDIYGQNAMDKIALQAPVTKTDAAPRKPAARSVKTAPQAPSGTHSLRKIVLDPGHGGKDPGAIGVGGVTEKEIVLNIAKRLAVKLRREMGVEVVLTRTDDRFVALEDRTALANAEDADLFISLHMNASPNADARGVETYYLDNTTDEAAIRLAARENGTSRRNISDLQFILSDMMQSMKQEDSIALAHRLQGSLVGGMNRVMGDVKDLGVKKALFYVLVGARMPSVLVEMFFITNRIEGRAMRQQKYQDAMVEALFDGIQKYGQSTMIARTL